MHIQTKKNIDFLFLFSLSIFLMFCSLSNQVLASTPIRLEVGSGRLIELNQAVVSAFAADPKVAEARPASSTTLFVLGVAPGQTTISTMDSQGKSVIQYDIIVVPSGYRGRQVEEKANAKKSSNFSAVAGEKSLTVKGSVDTPEEGEVSLEAARDASGNDDVYDHIRLHSSIQVNLQVQIVEMSRQLVREIGVEWQSMNALGTSAAIGLASHNPLATLASNASSFSFLSRFKIAGRSTTLETIIDALAQDQLVHMLAEPNLTTMSGEPASFLVGGEYPIPISSYNNTVSVQFKKYGVSLSFVPTVLSGERINLHVRPEVSQLSSDGAVSLGEGNSSISIPSIKVRRADTTVELGSGQSFAIAGLFQDNTTLQGFGIPGLGDIPILGALFKSDSFQHNQSELVIIVTPYIVKPVSNPNLLSRPDDNWTPPGDYQRVFKEKQNGEINKKLSNIHHDQDVSAGFILE